MNTAHHRLPPAQRLVSLLCVATATLLFTNFARADAGHDHGPAVSAANPNAPQRLADGAVFLPKPAQRQLAVRTLPVAGADLARTVELSGRVTMDPNAGGKVQSTVAGRLMPGPRGLPVLGQTVRRGEVLAHVVPSTAPGERAGQWAQLAELRAAESLAQKRLARLRELADSVPRKEIEAAEAELASTEARARAIGGGLDAREALVAPVSGVIASAQAVAGQVVDARELIYEVVDPTRLQV
ncbi:MAG: HlyD family secretion protein, partial [Variovorax sp.]